MDDWLTFDSDRRQRFIDVELWKCNMPDPDFSDGGHTGEGPFGDAIDTDAPLFVVAAGSCQDIIGG